MASRLTRRRIFFDWALGLLLLLFGTVVSVGGLLGQMFPGAVLSWGAVGVIGIVGAFVVGVIGGVLVLNDRLKQHSSRAQREARARLSKQAAEALRSTLESLRRNSERMSATVPAAAELTRWIGAALDLVRNAGAVAPEKMAALKRKLAAVVETSWHDLRQAVDAWQERSAQSPTSPLMEDPQVRAVFDKVELEMAQAIAITTEEEFEDAQRVVHSLRKR